MTTSAAAPRPASMSRRMPLSLRAVALAAVALTGLGVLPAAAQPVVPELSGAYIVRVVPGAAVAVAGVAKAAGLQVDRTLNAVDTVILQATASEAQKLRGSTGVLGVTPDGTLRLNGYYAGNDATSLFKLQNATDARVPWQHGTAGQNVDVAVIDSGVDRVKGLDAPGKVVYGPDFTPENADPATRNRDTFGHGTHMAGIIAAMDQQVETSMYNENVFHGVAPRARIVSLKVATRTGETTVTAVLSALDWVVANRYTNGLNLRVLNLSFGTDSTQDYKVDPIAYAVEKAWHSGITVVVSAGNNGTTLGQLDNPARDPFVIVVGSAQTHGTAATSDDSVSTFSSRGNGSRNPDLVAPGQGVQSLRVKSSYLDTTNPAGILDARFFRGSGTSQAAAFVSGVAALMISRYGMAPDVVKATLRATANPIAGSTMAAQGAGLVDVDEAVLQNPVPSANQIFTRSTGTGSLDAAGDPTVAGKAWAGKAWAGKAWAMQQE